MGVLEFRDEMQNSGSFSWQAKCTLPFVKAVGCHVRSEDSHTASTIYILLFGENVEDKYESSVVTLCSAVTIDVNIFDN